MNKTVLIVELVCKNICTKHDNKYIFILQSAMKNVEKYLTSIGKSLPKRSSPPIPINYRSELDISKEFSK